MSKSITSEVRVLLAEIAEAREAERVAHAAWQEARKKSALTISTAVAKLDTLAAIGEIVLKVGREIE